MNSSELARLITDKQKRLSHDDVVLGMRSVTRAIKNTLLNNQRVELRGFGCFKAHYRKPYTGRNPRTGQEVKVAASHLPRFKPAGKLRTQINNGAH